MGGIALKPLSKPGANILFTELFFLATLFFLQLGMSDQLCDKLCNKWYNELGSCMEITNCCDGSLTGWYHTSVGEAAEKYVLAGRYDKLPGRRSLGWTVTWTNDTLSDSESTTSWCGQYQSDENGEKIITMWLLTEQTKPSDDWKSTLVGSNVFTKNRPTPEECKKIGCYSHASHPKKAI